MSDPYPPPLPPEPRPRWWLRLLIFGALVVLLPLLIFFSYYLYARRAADQEIREAIAQADELDPGWRLEELEARRKAIPEERNAALVAMKVKQLLPSPWPSQSKAAAGPFPGPTDPTQTMENGIYELPPEVQLDARQARWLREELMKAGPAVTEARRLAEMPEGRFPIKYTPDFISTLLSCQDARAAAQLLSLDARLLAQEGKAEEALSSVCALLNAGRAVGDEPMLISQLVRMACQGVALAALERVLAQGEVSAKSLERLQRELEREAAEPLLLYGARGERAGNRHLMENIEKGVITPAQIMAAVSNSKPSGLEALATDLSSGFLLQQAHGWILRWMNDFVETAKLPAEEQGQRVKELGQRAQAPDVPILARLLVPAVAKVAQAFRRSQSDLRCGIVAVAAERFRLDHGRWPRNLNELTPKYLAKVPLDAHDGKPIRFKGLADGVLVYNVGPDGKDDGGKIDRLKATEPGTDRGFRLWDVAQRRQPPLNPDIGPPRPTALDLQWPEEMRLDLPNDGPPEK